MDLSSADWVNVATSREPGIRGTGITAEDLVLGMQTFAPRNTMSCDTRGDELFLETFWAIADSPLRTWVVLDSGSLAFTVKCSYTDSSRPQNCWFAACHLHFLLDLVDTGMDRPTTC